MLDRGLITNYKRESKNKMTREEFDDRDNMPVAKLFTEERPLILGVSGASGLFYTIEVLSILKEEKIFSKIYLIITPSARRVFAEEVTNSGYRYDEFIDELFLTKNSVDEIEQLHYRDIGRSIASGGEEIYGMAIIPTTSNTLNSIALGLAENLLSRAAFVTIKEKRRLLLVLREAPYTTTLLKNMLSLAKDGIVVASASPGFYIPGNLIIENIARAFARRLLALLGVELKLDKYRDLRWKGKQ